MRFIVLQTGDPWPSFTLEQWCATAPTWPDVPAALIVPNDVDVQTLRDDLGRIGLVALTFPKWTDGRAYSQARLLRVRLGFGGEIRATGDVLADMALPLARTGFDSAVLRADQDVEIARRALRCFDALRPQSAARRGPHPYYQGDVLDPRPLFLQTAP